MKKTVTTPFKHVNHAEHLMLDMPRIGKKNSKKININQNITPQTSMSRPALSAWQRLRKQATRMQSFKKNKANIVNLMQEEGRHDALTFALEGLMVDCTKQKINLNQLKTLFKLAQQVDLTQHISALAVGARVNISEKRPALHMLLRTPAKAVTPEVLHDTHQKILNSFAEMSAIVEKIHHGQWRGVTGKAITDIINIGVGGSELGTLMSVHALHAFKAEAISAVNFHFMSGMDGSQLAELLPKLNPETTLCIIASKSFATLDTLFNAETTLSWLMNMLNHDEVNTRFSKQSVLAHHFIGISMHRHLMQDWGIPTANQLKVWSWVGGRFSVWSAIGLPLAIFLGMAQFKQFLAGAHAVDTHFIDTPLTENIPVVLGLLSVWNTTFLNKTGFAILPYHGHLSYFPKYLAQLEMESNGKHRTQTGEKITYNTSPIVWGDVGSNAQHAFYQLLHQGTLSLTCDFIGVVAHTSVNTARHGLNQHALWQHQQLNLANCLAQSQVLMSGNTSKQATAQDQDKRQINPNDSTSKTNKTNKHAKHQGNTPSTTILLSALTPYSLGALMAVYEHKVFVMATIWNINPFDQWGVESGKQQANQLYLDLNQTFTRRACGAKASPDLTDSLQHSLHAYDPSTLQLLSWIQKQRGHLTD